MHRPPTGSILYALLCIVVPMVWGLLVVWASNAIERRVRRNRENEDVPPIEYHI